MSDTTDYVSKYPNDLAKNLLWCRNYHLRLAKEIEGQLLNLSKKHEMTITLEK